MAVLADDDVIVQRNAERLIANQQIEVFLDLATGTANEAFCLAAGTQELRP